MAAKKWYHYNYTPNWVFNDPDREIVAQYSNLSNKRDVTLTDFEKFNPLQKNFHPPGLSIS